MNTRILADTIAYLDKELLDEVIEEHYKRTMEKKAMTPSLRYAAIAAAAILLTASAAVPIIVINNKVSNDPPSEISTIVPQSSQDIDQYMPAHQLYEHGDNAAFAHIHIDRIYDGVYDENFYRFIMADCTVIDDFWDQLPAGTTVTVMFCVYGKSASGTESTLSTTSDGDDFTSHKTMFFDDEAPYKAFLSEHPDALMYIRYINKVSEINKKNVYTGESTHITAKRPDDIDENDKNADITDYWPILHHCYFTTFGFIPLSDGKVDLSALESFMRDHTCHGWSSPEEQSIDFSTLLCDQMTIEKAKENIKKITKKS